MKYRILLVEDDETMVDILKRNLEKWGYLVHVAEDFQNVMQEFQDFEPQLVLMDISLPFYNGYYWCGEIRKVSKVPVIFLSSSGDDMNLVMATIWGRMILWQAVSDGSADGQDPGGSPQDVYLWNSQSVRADPQGTHLESGHFRCYPMGRKSWSLGKMNSEFYGH